MNCVTFADAPWYGIATSSSLAPCSGHGSCDNNTGLCLCFDGFNGGNDLFDFRVGKAADGQYLSLDCNNVIRLQTAFWALLLISFLVRHAITSYVAYTIMVKPLGANAEKLFRHKDGSRRPMAATWYLFVGIKHRMLHILIFDVTLANPLVEALCVVKIADPGAVVGTDWIPSALLGLGVLSVLLSHSMFSSHQFNALTSVKSGMAGKDELEALRNRYRRFRTFSLVAYFALNTLPTMASLASDKSKGPIKSLEVVAMMIRNAGVVFWMVTDIFANRLMKRECDALQETLAKSMISSQQVLNVMNFIQNAAKSLQRQLFVGLFLYTFAMLPWFWPFQTYLISFSFAFGSVGSNLGLMILRSRRAQDRAAAIVHSNGTLSTSNEERKAKAKDKEPTNPSTFSSYDHTAMVDGFSVSPKAM